MVAWSKRAKDALFKDFANRQRRKKPIANLAEMRASIAAGVPSPRLRFPRSGGEGGPKGRMRGGTNGQDL
jgi:hypothetical protein